MSARPVVTIDELADPAERSRVCDSLLRALPAWFGIESSIVEYVADVARMPTFAARIADGGPAVGILGLHRHNEWTAEIHVMAVYPDHHRAGIGRALVAHAETAAAALGHEFLTVKTLGPSRANREYDLTRAFYQGVGFRPVEEFKTLWGAGNPCLLLIKSL